MTIVWNHEPLSDAQSLPQPQPPEAPTRPPQSTPERPPRSSRRRIIAAAGAAVAVVVYGFAARDSDEVAPPTAAEVDATASSIAAEAIEDFQSQPARSSQIYRTVIQSLVVIQTTASGEDERGDERGDERRGSGDGLGTGVIVNADGSILTAYHVIDGATTIRVRFIDGTEATAEVVASDPANDTAVLMADGSPEVIVPAVLGVGPQVGDEVYAIGHPLGLVFSMSAGVVSGLNRTVPVPNGSELVDLIQFDAAVNPGNSGGPLLNANAEVVGIVSALANPSDQGFFVGIGFAVPIATAGGAAGSPPQ